MGQFIFMIALIIGTAGAVSWMQRAAVGHCVDVTARATVEELQRADIRRTAELIHAVQALREDLKDALDDEGLVCGGGDDAAAHSPR